MKHLVGYVVVAILVLILGVQYALSVGDMAERDRLSNCNALMPTPFNRALGKFPVVAPDFEALDYTGKKVPLSAYRGRVVFLNFWATWCPPCVEEMPSMEILQRELDEEAFTILAVASEPDWSTVHRFFPRGTNMTVLLDPPKGGEQGSIGPIAQRFGTTKLPETYVLDKNGRIRYYFVNKRDWRSPRALQCLRSLIDE